MVLFDCQPTKYVACVMVKCQSLLTMEVNVCISVCTFVFNKACNMHIFPCGNTHHLCYIVTEDITCPGITYYSLDGSYVMQQVNIPINLSPSAEPDRKASWLLPG